MGGQPWWRVSLGAVVVATTTALVIIGLPGSVPAEASDDLRVVIAPRASTLLSSAPVGGTISVTGDGTVDDLSVVVTARGPHARSVRTTTDRHGRASFSLRTLPAGHYTVSATVTAGGRTGRAPTVPLDVQPDHGTSIMLNAGRSKSFGAGESIWVRGRAFDSRHRPVAGQRTKIQRHTSSGWHTVAIQRTNKDGWYSHRTRAGGSAVTYRAYTSSRRHSVVATFTPSTTSSIGERESALSFGIGPAHGPVKETAGVRWREYDRGTLVQVGPRTWYVQEPVLKEWRRAGGLSGRLGPPVTDLRCRLGEGACIQKFEHGTVYDNPRSRHGVTTAVATADTDPTLAAVAMSQDGLEASHDNKYVRWMFQKVSKVPWCGVFLSWLGAAAGDPDSVPKAKTYQELITTMRREATLSHEPAVGRLAFISNVKPGVPTHAGVVVDVDGDTVTTIEGNVDAGGGPDLPRGVHRSVHTDPADIIFYADPLD